MSASWYSIFGLAGALLGVLMLFRYGMPFRVASGGVTYLITESINESERDIDRRYTILGYVGLFFVTLGTLLQMYGAYLSH
jgi:hypothetical protein